MRSGRAGCRGSGRAGWRRRSCRPSRLRWRRSRRRSCRLRAPVAQAVAPVVQAAAPSPPRRPRPLRAGRHVQRRADDVRLGERRPGQNAHRQPAATHRHRRRRRPAPAGRRAGVAAPARHGSARLRPRLRADSRSGSPPGAHAVGRAERLAHARRARRHVRRPVVAPGDRGRCSTGSGGGAPRLPSGPPCSSGGGGVGHGRRHRLGRRGRRARGRARLLRAARTSAPPPDADPVASAAFVSLQERPG